ncbi:RING-H2 finger protein ATL63-like [Glycine soja]|uniref:RING-H2 finger protein ATL63-like n=1 Tax=Glycine soja TaxID=3848 RepID=UPI001039D9D8|nr:RING-H2 finger protein ATL63-like [Glycine soja]
MPTQPDSPPNNNTLTQMFQNIFSDNSNIMLAAIISLLLVILFVLLLHLYAKWFLAQAQAQANARRRRRRRRTMVTVSDVLGPARFHHFHSFTIEDSSPLSTKGLDSSTIRTIPLFIYEHNNNNNNKKVQEEEEEEEELECVICLSAFKNGEVGRCLPKCGHGFHVECIDMWLSSHSNCPICRTSIVASIVENNSSDDHHGGDHHDLVEIVTEGGSAAPSSETREGEHGNRGARTTVSVMSVNSSSEFFGCSLERMLGKVFPISSNVN